MLLQEIEAWRSSRAGEDQSRRDRARLESAERKLQRQIERLVDAYQAGAISVEELKARRERLDAEQRAVRVRLQEVTAQDQDRARVEQLTDDVKAFAATLREGLDKLDFASRQRLVRLLIERVVVTGDHVAIEHAIPLSGRFSVLRSQDRCPRVPSLQGADEARRPGDRAKEHRPLSLRARRADRCSSTLSQPRAAVLEEHRSAPQGAR
ncbi:hypothetical protein [Sorangium sp. So ce1078]|uniref:hypothetical protein n=1 Tax=Sorangium sp. So ce1078 TaxID=3133329 RepID=UPI003F60AD3B